MHNENFLVQSELRKRSFDYLSGVIWHWKGLACGSSNWSNKSFDWNDVCKSYWPIKSFRTHFPLSFAHNLKWLDPSEVVKSQCKNSKNKTHTWRMDDHKSQCIFYQLTNKGNKAYATTSEHKAVEVHYLFVVISLCYLSLFWWVASMKKSNHFGLECTQWWHRFNIIF